MGTLFTTIMKLLHLPILLSPLVFAEIPAENAENPTFPDIMKFTPENFETVSTENDFLLIKFMEEGNQRSDYWTEDMKSVADALKSTDISITVGDVDVSETELAEKLGNPQVPSIILIKTDYLNKLSTHKQWRGPPSGDLGGKWVEKNAKADFTVKIENMETVGQLKNDNELIVVGLSESFKDCESFKEISYAKSSNRLQFALVDEKLAEELGLFKNELIILTNFDDAEMKFKVEGDFNIEEFEKFIRTHSSPLVIEFNQDNTERHIAPSGIPHAFMFFGSMREKNPIDPHKYDKIVGTLTENAKKYKGKVMFITADIEVDEISDRFMKHIKVEKEECPTYRMIYFDKNGQSQVFTPESNDVSSERVGAFVSGVLEGEIKADSMIGVEGEIPDKAFDDSEEEIVENH